MTQEKSKITLESLDAKVTEALAVLAELRPYLPLLGKAAALLDNPAARFKAAVRRHR